MKTWKFLLSRRKLLVQITFTKIFSLTYFACNKINTYRVHFNSEISYKSWKNHWKNQKTSDKIITFSEFHRSDYPIEHILVRFCNYFFKQFFGFFRFSQETIQNDLRPDIFLINWTIKCLRIRWSFNSPCAICFQLIQLSTFYP